MTIESPKKPEKKYSYVRKSVTWEGRRCFVRGKTAAEANQKMGVLLEKLKRGEIGISRNMILDNWYAEWKKAYKEPLGLTAKGLKAYDEKYYGYVSPAIGQMPIANIKKIHLQKILNSQAGKSFSHVARLRNHMKQLFREAKEENLLTIDPSTGIKLPECSTDSHRVITPEERALILEVAKEHPAGPWILTMLYAGLRPGETAALLWKDIDFEKNEIHIYQALESGGRKIKGPKTKAGIRDIPMREELAAVLKPASKDPAAPVFPTEKGGFQNSASLARKWKSFKRALDIRMGAKIYRNKIVESVVAADLTPYCLRHTFCTDLESMGIPINIAKVLMGHADIQTTAKIYTHTQQDVLHKEMEKFKARPTPKIVRMRNLAAR
jgi:integrase